VRFPASPTPTSPGPSAPAAAPSPLSLGDTRTSAPPGRPSSPRIGVIAAVAVVLGIVGVFLWIPRQSTPPRVAPAPPPPAVVTPAPAAAPAAAAEPARLHIDFDHPLKRGKLRVFVDDELTLDQRLTGQETKRGVVFTVHEGSFKDELEVSPGLHEVRVEVAWEGNVKVERIVGNFRSGVTRTLEASLGRLRRDLKLEWK